MLLQLSLRGGGRGTLPPPIKSHLLQVQRSRSRTPICELSQELFIAAKSGRTKFCYSSLRSLLLNVALRSATERRKRRFSSRSPAAKKSSRKSSQRSCDQLHLQYSLFQREETEEDLFTQKTGRTSSTSFLFDLLEVICCSS